MLQRLFYDKLLAWKQRRSRKAMLVAGARQTGKTSLIRKFGMEQYACLAEINFIETPRAADIFRGDLDANSITAGITALLGRSLEPGNTLVFLDEIQECPEARTAIKFLVEDGRFDYIESGSLLGVNSREARSYPVGFEEMERMYPMNLEEFALANGVQPEIFALLRQSFAEGTPVAPAVHEAMLRLFRLYMIVGGMPAVVQEFVNSHDLGSVARLQREILSAYRLDIAKYSERSKDKIRDIFDRSPFQLDDKNRRFMLSAIKSTARLQRYEESFVWLRDADVALPCYNVSSPTLPLRLNEQRTLFKLFLSDTGLLCAAGMDNVQPAILNGDLSVNEGSILENLFAQSFAEKGFPLHYFTKQRYGEVDFILSFQNRCLPVEIKSGRSYKSHAALDNILQVSEWDIREAWVFCMGNVERVGKVLYLPWYMAMFVEHEPAAAPGFSVDLSILTQPGKSGSMG